MQTGSNERIQVGPLLSRQQAIHEHFLNDSSATGLVRVAVGVVLEGIAAKRRLYRLYGGVLSYT